ncbi:DinB family protein [Haloactinopolyspora alba]|uniref:DinB family protein n=1 Tax=Haloactinopolyspora alba TaxID=648780 RepID=A0A2P8EFE8_9ACTN|nr:DinB family protein [Haloactinopolyspora alba]PSL08196.1 DinB family protein [Haloactinopolyspora alba]
MTSNDDTVAADEAVRRAADDHDLLTDLVRDLPDDQLFAPYRVGDGPLGHFCDSLGDLVAHILMWDEINLAVLTEARSGRMHWSLDPRWEIPPAGVELNRAGVAAGREISGDQLLHRFDTVRDALLDELSRVPWTAAPAFTHPVVTSMGALAQYVMSVPGGEPFRHVGIHLGATSGSTEGGHR